MISCPGSTTEISVCVITYSVPVFLLPMSVFLAYLPEFLFLIYCIQLTTVALMSYCPGLESTFQKWANVPPITVGHTLQYFIGFAETLVNTIVLSDHQDIVAEDLPVLFLFNLYQPLLAMISFNQDCVTMSMLG